MLAKRSERSGTKVTKTGNFWNNQWHSGLNLTWSIMSTGTVKVRRVRWLSQHVRRSPWIHLSPDRFDIKIQISGLQFPTWWWIFILCAFIHSVEALIKHSFSIRHFRNPKNVEMKIRIMMSLTIIHVYTYTKWKSPHSNWSSDGLELHDSVLISSGGFSSLLTCWAKLRFYSAKINRTALILRIFQLWIHMTSFKHGRNTTCSLILTLTHHLWSFICIWDHLQELWQGRTGANDASPSGKHCRCSSFGHGSNCSDSCQLMLLMFDRVGSFIKFTRKL